MSHFVPVLLVIGVVLVALVALGLRGNQDGGLAGREGGRASGAGATRDRRAEDMRATPTSRVADEVAILDELSLTSPGYRQYCELVGTSQATGGVLAPYSRREVAYYDVRCYRIENRGAGDFETLVAHETSIEPFSFTDGSTDTPVYVDLASFGDNVILVNSTNHIEGPGSDFARAADVAGGRDAAGAPGAVSALTGCVGRGVRMPSAGLLLGAAHVVGGAVAVGRGCAVVLAHARRLVQRLAGAIMRARDVKSALPVWASGALALAPAGPGCDLAAGVPPWRAHVSLAGGRGPAGRPRPGGSVTRGPHHGLGRPDDPPPRHVPGPAMPPAMGRFLGGPGGYSGVPRPRSGPRAGGDVLTGMALGALLGSLASGGGTTAAATSSFRGYRLVEDVVPLGSPVYCIGELYRSGERVCMGASRSVDYPTSYFATRPEAEVLSRLGG